MRFYYYILFTSILIFTNGLNAQKDTLFAGYIEDFGLIVSPIIKQGQTVFSLSYELGSNIKETMALNEGRDLDHLSLGTSINIKLNPGILSTDEKAEVRTPVIYTVKAKETLYTIARIYLGVDVKDLMEMNNKHTNTLAIGERLLIGYINSPTHETVVSYETSTEGKSNTVTISESSSVIPDHHLSVGLDSFQLESFEKKMDIIHKERGLAMWENTQYGGKELLVMHPNAKINSIIKLYNPMMNKAVEAKVVGTMPKNSYPQNISIVISPGVAHALGALDKRFLVEMTYTQ